VAIPVINVGGNGIRVKPAEAIQGAGIHGILPG